MYKNDLLRKNFKIYSLTNMATLSDSFINSLDDHIENIDDDMSDTTNNVNEIKEEKVEITKNPSRKITDYFKNISNDKILLKIRNSDLYFERGVHERYIVCTYKDYIQGKKIKLFKKEQDHGDFDSPYDRYIYRVYEGSFDRDFTVITTDNVDIEVSLRLFPFLIHNSQDHFIDKPNSLIISQ